jgi:endonuclease/exonuclease/phosphatase family metal-dependent hydrolase
MQDFFAFHDAYAFNPGERNKLLGRFAGPMAGRVFKFGKQNDMIPFNFQDLGSIEARGQSMANRGIFVGFWVGNRDHLTDQGFEDIGESLEFRGIGNFGSFFRCSFCHDNLRVIGMRLNKISPTLKSRTARYAGRMKMRFSLVHGLQTLALCALTACQTANPQDPAYSGDLRPAAVDASAESLVVMSYNIHHGQGSDGVFDLARIAQLILDAEPDLVALQEVDVRTRRASGVDQAAELARLTGMHVAFARAIRYSGGEYGDAVLSRYPILKVDRLALRAQPEHEARVAVVALLSLPKSGRKIRFVSTHLDHTKDPADRIAQANQLLELLGSEPSSKLPTLLVGDLNAQPDSTPIDRLLTRFDSAAPLGTFTFPADQPDIQIDWILMSAQHGWQVSEIRVVPEVVASDHRPLWARLALSEQ